MRIKINCFTNGQNEFKEPRLVYLGREAESSRAENPEDKTHQELDKLKRDLTPRQERKKARHKRWVARREAQKDFLEKKIDRREEKGRNIKPLERRIGQIERQVARYDKNGNWLNRRERQVRLEKTLKEKKDVPEVINPWERDTSYDDFLYFGPDQPQTEASYVSNDSATPEAELPPYESNLREIRKWLNDPYLGEIEYIAQLVLPNFKKEILSDEKGSEEVLQQIREKLKNNDIGAILAGDIKIYLEGKTERRAEHIARLENIHSKLDSLSTNQLRELAKIFDPTLPDEDLKIEAFVKGVPTKDGTLIGILPWLKEDLKNAPADFTFKQAEEAEKYLSTGKTEPGKKQRNQSKPKAKPETPKIDKTEEDVTARDPFEGIPIPDVSEPAISMPDSSEGQRLYTPAEKEILEDPDLPEYPEEISEDGNTNGGV